MAGQSKRTKKPAARKLGKPKFRLVQGHYLNRPVTVAAERKGKRGHPNRIKYYAKVTPASNKRVRRILFPGERQP